MDRAFGARCRKTLPEESQAEGRRLGEESQPLWEQPLSGAARGPRAMSAPTVAGEDGPLALWMESLWFPCVEDPK